MSDDFDINRFSAELADIYINRTIDTAKDFYKFSVDKITRKLQKSVETYLANCHERFGMTKTFFNSENKKPLYSFYVPLDLSHRGQILKETGISFIAKKHDVVIIAGTAGSGKSTFTRHLLLDAISQKTYLPVFYELKRITDEDTPLIVRLHNAATELGLEFSESHFEDAMEKGEMIIILDGFDEIPHYLRDYALAQIIDTYNNFQNSKFVVSTRPDEDLASINNSIQFKVKELRTCLQID